MPRREATCACGQLKAICSQDPVLVSLCHCPACQKRTGSTFGIAAFFEHDTVAVIGDFSTYERASDSGHPVTHNFCPRCGSTVCWKAHRKPNLVAVASGAFADPCFPAPTQSVYTEHRHPWIDLPFEKQP